MTGRFVAAAMLVALQLAGAAPARAEALIQPGAEAVTAEASCTLNFVFTDASSTYIGGPGNCTDFIGERVQTSDGDPFGTVVYRVYRTATPPPLPIFGAPILDQSQVDSFALIRIDEDEVANVSPVVLGLGAAPTGYTTSEETAEGDEVFMYGQAPVLNATGTTAQRRGTLDRDDAQTFWTRIVPVAFGDAGAPVIRTADNRALGVMSFNGVPSSRGTTVERILVLLAEAGFDVTLVTSGA